MSLFDNLSKMLESRGLTPSPESLLRLVPLPPGWTWHPSQVAVLIPGAQLELAAEAGGLFAKQFKSVTVRVEAAALHVEAETKKGHQVAARVAPAEIRLGDGVVTFVCDLPDGVDVQHKDAVYNILIKWFIRVLGCPLRAAQPIPGVTANGKQFEWQVPFAASSKLGTVVAAAVKFGVLSSNARLRCQIVDGQLQIGPVLQ